MNLIRDAEAAGLLEIKNTADYERIQQRLTADAEFRERLLEQVKQKIKEQSAKPYITQKEQRAVDRKKKEEQAELAGLTQDDILKRCQADGKCQVTIETLKSAFPKMVTTINGNNFMLGIKDKEFKVFLQAKGLRFTLPDYVFIKTV